MCYALEPAWQSDRRNGNLSIMKRFAGILFFCGALAIVRDHRALAQSAGAAPTDPAKEWRTYGHDPGGMRFSPLTQLTPANVDQLKVAWVYHMKPAGAVAPIPERPLPGGAVGDN